jgi:hypothetical protein
VLPELMQTGPKKKKKKKKKKDLPFAKLTATLVTNQELRIVYAL